MRLGQLSRKISVRTNEIVEFLASKGVVVEDSFNARVDDEHVSRVISHFAPHLNSVALDPEEPAVEQFQAAEIHVEEPVQSNEPVTSSPASVETIEVVLPSEPLSDEASADTEAEMPNEVNGVIKAPRVELQGLKILGKIELPEPRKKGAAEASDAAGQTSPEPSEQPEQSQVRPHAERRKPSQRQRRPQDRPRKNPVAQERERREREQEEERKRKAEQEKQRKTHHYQKRVKLKGPTKAARIHDEDAVPVEDVQPQPTTLWGKFVKWLTS